MPPVPSVRQQPFVGAPAAPAVLLKLTDIPDTDPTQSLLELTDKCCCSSSTYSPGRQAGPRHGPHSCLANTDAHRPGRHDGGGVEVRAPSLAIATEDTDGHWSWPIVPDHYDTTAIVRPAVARAVFELGLRNLRRLQYHDPAAPGWHAIARLLRPLEAVNAHSTRRPLHTAGGPCST